MSMNYNYRLWDIYAVILWGPDFHLCSFCLFSTNCPKGLYQNSLTCGKGRKQSRALAEITFWFHESLISFPRLESPKAFHQHQRKSQPCCLAPDLMGLPTSPASAPITPPSAHGSSHVSASVLSSPPLGFALAISFLLLK